MTDILSDMLSLENMMPKIVHVGLEIIIALLVFFIGGKVIGVIRKHVRKLMELQKTEKGVIQFIDSLLKVVLYVVLVLILLKCFGVEITSITAIVASSGLTLGLALQGSLSNFAGGVIILLIKPFMVGDYIAEDTNKNEGFVQRIDLFYTTLRMINGRTVMVPNGTLANASLINYSKLGKIRIDVAISISYHADIKAARDVAVETMKKDEKCLSDQPVTVAVVNLADSSVDLACRCWVLPDEYWDTKERLTENIKVAFDANGIDIPFPQVTVSYEKDLFDN